MGIQTILPLVDAFTGNILGIVQTLSTTYAGTETTITPGGTGTPSYNAIKITPKHTSDNTLFYMGISVPVTMVRDGSYRSISAYAGAGVAQFKFQNIDNFVIRNPWRQPAGEVYNDMLVDQFGVVTYLTTAAGAYSGVVPAPVAPTASNGTVVWQTNVGFVSAPPYSFIDVNWVSLLNASFPNMTPGSIAIGTPSPSSIQTYVRAYVVQQPTVQGTTVTYTTIRFVKITGVEPAAGTYVYPVTITSAEGLTATANINLNIS
jgi:hypothetical protein